jgi:hypothetical protein
MRTILLLFSRSWFQIYDIQSSGSEQRLWHEIINFGQLNIHNLVKEVDDTGGNSPDDRYPNQ